MPAAPPSCAHLPRPPPQARSADRGRAAAEPLRPSPAAAPPSGPLGPARAPGPGPPTSAGGPGPAGDVAGGGARPAAATPAEGRGAERSCPGLGPSFPALSSAPRRSSPRLCSALATPQLSSRANPELRGAPSTGRRSSASSAPPGPGSSAGIPGPAAAEPQHGRAAGCAGLQERPPAPSELFRKRGRKGLSTTTPSGHPRSEQAHPRVFLYPVHLGQSSAR